MRGERPRLSRRSSVGSEQDVRGSFDDFWMVADGDGGVQGVGRPFGRARGGTLWEDEDEDEEEGFELTER